MSKTQDIRDAVEQELSFDPFVNASGITVKNINGDVALNGAVPNYPQYTEAAAAARRVAGVKTVHNHLEVELAPGDYHDDPTLTTVANDALRLNLTVPDGVEATAKDGNLRLIGTVGYGIEMTAAELTVAGLTRCPKHRERHPDQQRRGPGRRHCARPGGVGPLGADSRRTATFPCTPTGTR